jgi:oxygen-independent coproporphyrinogen-3 oxidase
MFRAKHSPELSGPIYCCQADGMVGLGCGARSYTNSLHYSTNYAVEAKQIDQILQAYIASPEEAFDYANYGFQLDSEECRRRYVLLSLLSDEGLNCTAYRTHFGTDVFADLPELSQLVPLGLATLEQDTLHLTDVGIERSDTIGAWLFSDKVRHLMEEYEPT